jgi:RiboL-PSP-HEPN
MGDILLRTKSEIEDCAKHLQSSATFGTEIESYLTQYLVVVLCADIQQEMYRLSEERASVAKDIAISSYVSTSARKVLRSVRKDEIAKFVGMFGPASLVKLNSLVSDAEVTIFNNAVSNRHDVAHKQGARITFQELKDAVAIAEKLLDAVDQSLIRST